MKWRQPADRRVVEAVIAAFREPADLAHSMLQPLSQGQWERSYHWLDASGLALYFLARIDSVGLQVAMPAATLARLNRNLADNRVRNASMLAEFVELNSAFQQAEVDYCNLKGFTLSPDFCADPSLRTQLDFDFLVDGRDLNLCRELLASTGYVRTAATATEWQFEAGTSEFARIEDHYKPKPQRSVELHFTCDDAPPHGASRDDRLGRLSSRSWNGVRLPVLSPADQFIAQALHILSHLRSACTRPSWLLEYKCNLDTRSVDWAFWEEVEESSRRDPYAPIAIGLATLLSAQLFGCAAPVQLNRWTLDRLPVPVRLWAELHGRKAVLADGPGTKLHLLLEDELERGDRTWGQRRKSLLPMYCATRLCLADPRERLKQRMRREYYQIRFALFRLRFHVVEGIRYAFAAARWRRQLTRETRSHHEPTRGAQPTTEPS